MSNLTASQIIDRLAVMEGEHVDVGIGGEDGQLVLVTGWHGILRRAGDELASRVSVPVEQRASPAFTIDGGQDAESVPCFRVPLDAARNGAELSEPFGVGFSVGGCRIAVSVTTEQVA